MLSGSTKIMCKSVLVLYNFSNLNCYDVLMKHSSKISQPCHGYRVWNYTSKGKQLDMNAIMATSQCLFISQCSPSW